MTDQEKQRLQEIEERANKATQGQWEVTDLGECEVHVTIDYKYENGIHRANWIATMDDDDEATTQEERINNADFIAHSREDIPFLLQQLRASLEREREKDALNKTYHDVLMRSGFNPQSLDEYIQRLNEWKQNRGES